MSDKRSDDLVLPLGGAAPLNGLKGSTNRFLPRQSPGGESSVAAALGPLKNSGAVAVLAYCLSSSSMTLVNKYVVSGNSWNLHLLYLAIQHVIVSASVIVCSQLGVIKDVDLFNPQKARKGFPIALMLVAMIFTGNKALQFLSVPVYTIFKNLTVIVIAYGEVLWFGGHVSSLSLMAFILMIFSSMIAAYADFSNAKSLDTKSGSVSSLNAGYFWMLLNVFTAATYALSMKKGMKSSLKNWDLIYYNNILTVPVLLGGSLILEDWSSTNLEKNFPIESRQNLIIGMIYSGLGALGISYCTAWCIRATSSTTYAMTGALNKLPLAILGLIFFSDPVTFGGVFAIILGFVSGIIYTIAKNNKPKDTSTALPLTNLQPMSASARSERDAAAGK